MSYDNIVSATPTFDTTTTSSLASELLGSLESLEQLDFSLHGPDNWDSSDPFAYEPTQEDIDFLSSLNKVENEELLDPRPLSLRIEDKDLRGYGDDFFNSDVSFVITPEEDEYFREAAERCFKGSSPEKMVWFRKVYLPARGKDARAGCMLDILDLPEKTQAYIESLTTPEAYINFWIGYHTGEVGLDLN